MTPKTFLPAVALDGFYLDDFASFSSEDRPSIVKKITKIEKKNFPSREAFDFDAELKKKNTNMILAIQEGESAELVGYMVYVRLKRLVLLHKICVVEKMRGQGIAKSLMHSLRLQLENQGGCQKIHLWVDEARDPARALYESNGFEQIDRCVDYYGPGRTGLKMELSIGK